jgi:hypothetical protein
MDRRLPVYPGAFNTADALFDAIDPLVGMAKPA